MRQGTITVSIEEPRERELTFRLPESSAKALMLYIFQQHDNILCGEEVPADMVAILIAKALKIPLSDSSMRLLDIKSVEDGL